MLPSFVLFLFKFSNCIIFYRFKTVKIERQSLRQVPSLLTVNYANERFTDMSLMLRCNRSGTIQNPGIPEVYHLLGILGEGVCGGGGGCQKLLQVFLTQFKTNNMPFSIPWSGMALKTSAIFRSGICIPYTGNSYFVKSRDIFSYFSLLRFKLGMKSDDRKRLHTPRLTSKATQPHCNTKPARCHNQSARTISNTNSLNWIAFNLKEIPPLHFASLPFSTRIAWLLNLELTHVK